MKQLHYIPPSKLREQYCQEREWKNSLKTVLVLQAELLVLVWIFS